MEQLELDFEVTRSSDQGAQVVEFSAFIRAREAQRARQQEQEEASLVAAIIKSVEHITGRSPDAEAM